MNHFIVSQVNPHSGLLAWMATANAWSSPLFTSVMGYMRFLIAQTRDWFKNLTDFLSFGSLTPMWSLRRGYVQALTQDYEGRDVDITINPWYGHISAFKAFNMTLQVSSVYSHAIFVGDCFLPMHISALYDAFLVKPHNTTLHLNDTTPHDTTRHCTTLQNPTLPVFKGMMRASESATYPALPRIHAHCCVEITLDQCVQRLRKRSVNTNLAVLFTASLLFFFVTI